MAISSKKAQNTALWGFCLSLVFFVVSFLFGGLWGTGVLNCLAWLLLSGAMVWLLLLIQFFNRSAAEQEKLDKSRLSSALQQDTIFTGGAGRASIFEQAQRRLAFFEKWLLPSGGIVIALVEIALGLLLLQKFAGLIEWKVQNPLLGAILMILIAFVCFLISRYATGMSSETAWRPLRAGGSYFLLTAFVAALSAVALVFAQYKYPIGLTILEQAVAWALIVLGVEIILNTIMDVYRPRVAGQYCQAGIDSRLLGLINEPGGLFYSVANAIDYQFGFQVSQTWFYKLLGKAILPLILFASAMLYLMTCVVIIGPGQMGVVEHFGSADAGMGGRQIGPGLAVKWPWPFDKVYDYPTDLIQKINIGFVEDDKEKGKFENNLLWGKEHFKEEYDLLVASAGALVDKKQDGTVPVSLVRANVPVMYRIKDVSAYLYNHTDSRKMLETLCYRELARFGASSTVETDEKAIEKSLLGRGRMEASRVLRQRIQKAADDSELGVEIVLCGLQGIHPPPKLAEDYENVIASIQTRQATVLDAMAERNRTLIELAGSADAVASLYTLVSRYSRDKESLTPEQDQAMRKEITAMLELSQGQVFQAIRQAEADAFEKAILAEATGQRFQGQLKAYQANPALYKRIERLKMLEETLVNVRKYVVAADSKDAQVYIVDLQEKLTSSLYEGLDIGAELQNKK
jgi:regulator of protease activity HflC (stomatin/prohibitin superfamily)